MPSITARRAPLAAFAAAVALCALPVAAQEFENQVNARQGQMKVMALNLGILGGMARGNMPYDADAAVTAAENLVVISQLDQTAMWPEGSDNVMLDTTRAQPSIWDNNADFLAKWEEFGTQAAAIVDVVGTGQEALGPALGGLGGTCQACHEAHRGPELN